MPKNEDGFYSEDVRTPFDYEPEYLEDGPDEEPEEVEVDEIGRYEDDDPRFYGIRDDERDYRYDDDRDFNMHSEGM